MRQTSGRSLSFLIFTSLLGLLLTTGCDFWLRRQNPQDAFAEGKFPKLLEEIANPKPDSTTLSESQSVSGLTVGVIDEGVDYLHPYLKNKIRYTVKDGAIVGAGWDFLGNDPWAHPNVVVSDFFAFGATLDADKRIVTHLEDPIAEMDRLNSLFVKRFVAAINSNEILKNTLFTKVTERAISVFGAFRLLQQKIYLKENYEEFKNRGILLTPQSKTNPSPQLTRLLKGLPDSVRRKIFDLPWGQNTQTGTPYFDSSHMLAHEICVSETDCEIITLVSGMDVFLDVLTKEFEAFDKETEFTTKYFEPYYQFRYSEYSKTDRNTNKENIVINLTDELLKAWLLVKTKYRLDDDIFALQEDLCAMLTDGEFLTLTSPTVPQAQKTQLVLEKIERTFGDTDLINKHIQGSDLSEEDQKEASTRELVSSPKYLERVKKMLADRGYDLLNCTYKPTEYKYQELYLNYAKRAYHPMLQSKSISKSHGSHVSGIILSQEPDARIFPMKVLVEQYSTTTQMDKIIRDKFFKEFEEWLNDPVVIGATKQHLGEHLGNPQDDVQAKAQVMALLKRIFPLVYQQNKLTFGFFYQLRDALAYAGEVAQLKLANISLGDELQSSVEDPNKDKIEDLAEKFKFLTYEFYKYSMSEVFNKRAPNTLFVIAAGNSATWFDGVSRSGLPCDLNSPFLYDYAVEAKLPLPPNARVRNTLCVGSIDSKHKLSSFTNLLIGPQSFVLSYGEAIVSTLKMEDCSGIRKSLVKENGYQPTLGASEKIIRDLLREKHGTPTTDEQAAAERDAVKSETIRLGLETGLLNVAGEAAYYHDCVTSSDFKTGIMSGTSMATPGVTGLLAHYVMQKMKKLNLTENEIYNHPEFEPTRLIQEISQLNPTFGGDYLIKDVRKIIEGYNKFSGGLDLAKPNAGAVIILPH